MLTRAFWNRLRYLWENDRDNLSQKIRKRLRNRLPLDKMLFTSGRALMPHNLTFEITHLCNLSCYMCDLYGTDAETQSQRSETYRPHELMDFDDYRRILDEVAAFKPSISLTGGEPMLSPHTLPFIRAAREQGLTVTMVSNLTRLKGRGQELVESGLSNLTVSLDGVGADHDYVRGKEGSFDETISALDDICSARDRLAKGTPTIQFNVTLTGRNQSKLLPLMDLAVDKGVPRIIFSHLWYWDSPMVKHHNQMYGHLAPVEEQNLKALEGLDTEVLCQELERIRQHPAFGQDVDVKFLPELTDEQVHVYYTDSQALVRPKHHCLSPWMNTRILPNGDVIPCIDSLWGNLKQQTFEEVWNSTEACRFREALQGPGVFPGCMRCCGLYSYE